MSSSNGSGSGVDGQDDLLDDLLSWEPSSRHAGGLSVPTTPVNVTVAKTGGAASEKAVGPRANTPTPLPGDAALALPADIDRRLFPHQREGVQWLYRKHQHARACLLADEMGLGKTIQVCTFLGQLYHERRVKTTLVVAPPTLVPMWKSALLEWGRLPRDVVEVVHGESRAARAAHWKKLSFGLPRVMVTTYGVLRQDVGKMSVGMVDYVVLDEAHVIKNADTDASEAARKLSAYHKIALTGTPLMNSFQDLWAIFAFLDGGILPITRGRFTKINRELLNANERDASPDTRKAAEETLQALQAAIRPYMLRREKKDVQVVASRKHDTVVWVTLSETQERLYRAVLGRDEVADVGCDAETEGVVSAVADAAPVVVSEAGSSGNALHQVTMLGQVCNHPWLQLTEAAFSEALACPLPASTLCEEVGDILSGSKLRAALTLVERCVAMGRKALVFSRSRMLLNIFARLLTDRNVRHARIDGSVTSVAERTRAVEAFNADASVKACLLTTQVGGVGLTFRSASCAILLDPSWNPAADTQAMDRVHRIGQESGDVFLFRLVTCGTIEEKIYRNQIFKTMAAKQTTSASARPGEADTFFRYFTRMQLKAMFVLGDLRRSETAAQLRQLHPVGVDPQVASLTVDLPNVSDVSDHGCVHNEDVAQVADSAPSEEEEDELALFLSEESRMARSPPQNPCGAEAEQGCPPCAEAPRLKRPRSPAAIVPRDAASSPTVARTDSRESCEAVVPPRPSSSLSGASLSFKDCESDDRQSSPSCCCGEAVVDVDGDA